MDTTQYYNQLNPIYDPQRAIINQQMAGLPEQYQQGLSALEQAKINAYRDIGTTAQGRGMQFSGFSPEQQARYLGATYMPAVANLKAKQTEQQTALQKALADISSAQQTQALNLYQTEATRKQQAEQWQKEMDWKAQQAELDRQASIKAAQYSRSSGGGGSTTTATTTGAGYYYTPSKSGGYNFFDAAGKPISGYEYAKNTGQGLYGLLSASNDAGDHKIAADIAAGMQIGELRKRYPWVFGGS